MVEGVKVVEGAKVVGGVKEDDEGAKDAGGVKVVGGVNEDDEEVKVLLLPWNLTPDEGKGVKGVLFCDWADKAGSTGLKGSGLKGSTFLMGSHSGVSIGRLSASEKLGDDGR